MEEVKNVDSCKYVMSLDTLDLALLPHSYRFSRSKAPIWTANCNLSSNFFEFEIKQKTVKQATTEDDKDSNTNNETIECQSDPNHQSGVTTPKSIPSHVELTTCHICDLDVPAAYVEEHENSLKHKAYLKIANVVLERTRRHMQRKSNKYVPKNNSMFFCEPCTSEVPVVDRSNHEKSKAHKRCVSLDRVLYELVDLYTHEENDYDEELSVVNNKFVDNNENKMKASETVDNKVVISDIRARLDELETKTIENYIKMIDEFNEDKEYVLSTVGNNLKISTDYYDIIVTEDNFNGFVRVDENSILCIVCKMLIREEKAHKVSDGHINNVATPFKDHHCIRNLDDMTSHCVICNKAVDNTDLHVLCDNTHSELLKKALAKKSKENKQKYIVEESTQCSNTSVEKKQSKEVHSDTSVEKKQSKEEHSNDSVEKKQSKEEHSNTSVEKKQSKEVHLDTFVEKKQSKEVQSDTFVEKKQSKEGHSNTSVEKHAIELTNHVAEKEKSEANKPDNGLSQSVHNGVGYNSDSQNTNGNRLLQSLTVTKTNPTPVTGTNNDMYLCPACNIEIHVNNVNSHVNGSKHAFNSKSELHYIMQDVGTVDLLCRVCGIYTADDVNEIKAHVTKMDHVNKYKTMLYDNYLINAKGNFFCKPCQAVVLKKNEFYHMEKLKHEVNLAALRGTVNTEQTTVKGPAHLLSDKIDVKEPVTNLKPSDKVPAHFCAVCQVYIPNNLYNISTHNNGMRHKKSALINEPGDIESSSSVAESSNITNEMDTTEDNGLIDEDYIIYHMAATGNDKTLTCRVCKSAVPNIDNSIIEHVIGKKHDTTLKAIINANDIICVEDGYFCNHCNKSFKTNDLFKHIDSVLHKAFDGLDQEREDNETLTSQTTDIVSDNEHDPDLYTEEAVMCHVAKQNHVHSYKELMSDYFIMDLQSCGHFCVICVCLVPLKGEVHHCTGARHKGNLIKAISKTTCDLCRVSDMNMTEHIRSNGHLSKVMKSQSLVHYCVFCKVLMPKARAEEHTNNCHEFAVKGKICFCTVCDPYLPVTSKRK